jgi:hypothetical protein
VKIKKAFCGFLTDEDLHELCIRVGYGASLLIGSGTKVSEVKVSHKPVDSDETEELIGLMEVMGSSVSGWIKGV